MIRSPIGLRIDLDAEKSLRDQIAQAARLGAAGVLLESAGDLAPHRLGETGRRDLKNTLQTVQVRLVALGLPTRKAFDTAEGLDDRLARAEKVFALAYELGTRLVVVRAGAVPLESDTETRATFDMAVGELARRADRHGVRLGLELHDDSTADMRALLERIGSPALGVSVDPVPLLQEGRQPGESIQELGPNVVHVYAPTRRSGAAIAAAQARLRTASRAELPVDWEAFLGSLEEIDYRGFVTVWPGRAADAAAELARLQRAAERF